MIEIAQHHQQTTIHLTERVLHRDLDVVKSDIRCPCRARVRRLELPGGDAFRPLNQYDREAAIGPASSSEVVAEVAVRDPPRTAGNL